MTDFYKYFDRLTFFLLMLISTTGIFLIYSASHSSASNYALRQSIWLLLAVLVFFAVTLMKTTTLFKLSYFIYFTVLFVLFLQLLFGHFTAGVKSWIRTELFNIQASELIKIPLALIIAKFMTKHESFSWGSLFRLLVVIFPSFLLIALQPDLGTAFLLTSFIFIAILLKGIRLYVLITLLILLAGSVAVSWNLLLKPYQKARLVSFIHPDQYSQTSGYQVIQSKIAIGAGGLGGQGYLKGSQAQMKFLPARHTDFILSVMGEEFGFMGISTLLFLYFLFFYRQFRIKVASDESFYYCYLFTGFIFFQFLVNTLMSIGFFPIMGVPLPFISYGGSSMITFFAGLAITFRMKLDYFSS